MNLVKPIRPMAYSFKERQSKFISNLRSMDRVSDFKTWIGELRKEYHDATHICWAYRIDDTNEIQEKFSDAGEPSGTAGLPILNAMKQNNVVGCGISVIRYFGGTKLGKRGLREAYGRSAREIINRASLKTLALKESFIVTCPINYYGDLSKGVQKMGGRILEDKSGESLQWVLEIESKLVSDLIHLIRSVTHGEGNLERKR